MHVYLQSEPRLWTVGFYTPDGKWIPESDHPTPEDAAKRVAFLEHGSSVVTLSVEGAKAILDAKAMLQRLYDNAQAIGGDSPIGWQIDTLDYQALEDFL